MRRAALPVGLLLLAPAAWAPARVSAQTKATAENVPEIRFTSVPDFIKMPAGLYLGESMGVASNSQGHFFVFTRSGDTRLFEFDASGKYVKEWGAGLYGFEFAHKVRVDSLDNVWAVDEGSNTVIKFNPQGRVEMVLGSRPEAALGVLPAAQMSPLNNKYLFARPTDVAFDAQGNIFISDGYTNSRVVKYDRNGRFLGQFATNVRGGGPDQLNTPHTIATDRQGNVYVGDRGNARVQVLTNDLKLKATYSNVGNPWEMCISQGPHQYLFVSNSNPDSNPAASWEITGEIYMMELDGTILGKFGRAGKELGQFQTVHGMDCRDPSTMLISEITAWRVQKLQIDNKSLVRREQ
jgi:DNA-binding beta-propeller fold protein YncE